jgi:ABC-2 type transport system ATP-binding protein
MPDTKQLIENVVEIVNVTKRFGDFTAVNNISLNIKRGEIFGLLGPNGAGKTTTINMILTLLVPTSGKIFIEGLENTKNHEKVKGMLGLMTQETVVEPELTARENLELFAKLYHIPTGKIDDKVNGALDEAELMEFADKKAGTFSGGMQRRLELVKSMIQDPKIIVLDEPTTGLDIQNRTKMWANIKRLSKTGITIIMTTQYLEEADVLCDRIAIIDHGKIRALGTASELKRLVSEGRILEIIVEPRYADQAAHILKAEFKLDAKVNSDKVTAIVKEATAMKDLSKIADEMHERRIPMLSIGMHLPTLDDVFIKLTGAGMRDTPGEQKGRMDRMRFGRR